MKSHASLNRIYRLVWSQVLNSWVAVAETCRGFGKGGSRKAIATVAAVAIATLPFGVAQADPTGGQVTSGSATITQSANLTTINQATQNASLSWKTFSIGANQTVNFVQPNSTSVAVNRIYDTNGSQIMGNINANGKVFLINPNGILFGQGAQINVGGLIASTLNMSDESLNSAARSFSGNGTGSIINQGAINTAEGGYVAFLGNTVSNQGTINSPLGTVALGAGSAATLTFDNNSLVQLQIDQSTLNNLAENKQLIKADGGMVLMSAGAKDSLLASVVNNSGVIEAQTAQNKSGKIILMGGMVAGTTNLNGTLDASAPNGGNGGFIETSAAHVKIADTAKITTAAKAGTTGKSGNWLIDPTDFTIAAGTAGDISGLTLSTMLGSSDVTIQTATGVNSASNLYSTATVAKGDINVNDSVTWSANKLTLKADNNININANLNATGGTSLVPVGAGAGSLKLMYGQATVAGGTSKYYINTKANASVTLAQGHNFSTQLGSAAAALKDFYVVTKLGLLASDVGGGGSVSTTDLQGINGNKAGLFALGNDIDASATSAGLGFTPIGSPAVGGTFDGMFDGLGHVIKNLTINAPALTYNGFFGKTSATTIIQNIGLVDVYISGEAYTAGLVALNAGLISNSYVTGSIHSALATCGGLVADNNGTIMDGFVTANVYGTSTVGGLAGVSNSGNIIRSYATGNVAGSTTVGGLVGSNALPSTVSESYAIGNVSGTTTVGGLMGSNAGLVHDVYATGNVTGTTTVGGLMGSNGGVLRNSYAAGKVTASATPYGALLGAGDSADSFWDTDKFGSTTSVGGGIGMNTANMMVQDNFTSLTAANSTSTTVPNWDFSNTWVILNGATYPLLQSLMTKLEVRANNVSTPYTGLAYAGSGAGVSYTLTLSNNVSVPFTPNLSSPLLGTLSYNINGGVAAVNAGDYTIAPNGQYFSNPQFFVQNINGTLSITPLSLSLTGATAAPKVYDGTTVASISGGVLTGLLSADASNVSLSTVGTFATKNVGTGINVISAGLVGAGSENYTVTMPTGLVANINRADLDLTANSVTKFYDGTLSAASTALVTRGTLFTDDSITGGNFAFTDKNAGASNKTVTYTGFSINDGNSGGNYKVNYTDNTTSTINQALLSLSTSNVDKIYDGGLTAAGTTTVTSGTLMIGDSLTSGTFLFSDKNVGTGKTVTTSGVTVGDTAGNNGNYLVSYAPNTGSSITAAQLLVNVTGTQVSNKVYDGTTTATLTGGQLVGVASNDQVYLTQTGNFATKNAGTGIAVTANDSLYGTDFANYTIIQPTNLTANITKASLSMTGATASSRAYNGTTAASVTGGVLSGLVSIAGVTDLVTVTTGTFNNKNAGTNKTVTAQLTGADAANYSIIPPIGLTANITPASLSITGNVTASNKVFDGTTLANVTGGSLTGTIYSPDVVALSNMWSFASMNVGTGIMVTANLSGQDAGNYRISQPIGLVGDITQGDVLAPESPKLSNLEKSICLASINGAASVTESADGKAFLAAPSKCSESNNTITVASLTPILKVENGGMKMPRNIIIIKDRSEMSGKNI